MDATRSTMTLATGALWFLLACASTDPPSRGQSEAASATAIPTYVTALQAAYGAESDGGFGSAVFYRKTIAAGTLDSAAQEVYQHFVGKSWTPARAPAWLGTWRQLYAWSPNAPRDIVSALRAIDDPDTRTLVPLLLDDVDDSATTAQALSAAMDSPDVAELAIYRIGDGEAMSGLLVAARHDDGKGVFLVLLLD